MYFAEGGIYMWRLNSLNSHFLFPFFGIEKAKEIGKIYRSAHCTSVHVNTL